VVESEGGHVGYSPASIPELALWRSIFEKRGRVEAEDVVSGTGLEHIEQLLSEDPHAKHAPGDTAIDLLLQCMGNVAGDHALAVLARGGVFLTGGVIAHVHTHIPKSRFLEAFCGKGAFSATMMQIPIHAVTNERVVLLGAAKLVM
jgi:glucokinase